jgi:pyruvate/2-oxoglutarate dehydrogenase complex dihydrolipoamide acyltransferase (E2) component
MAHEVSILMPKLTMAATECTFIGWLVADGSQVAEDQPLYIVETEKVETEVASSAAGVLRYGSVESGEVYPVGTQLGTIEQDVG